MKTTIKVTRTGEIHVTGRVPNTNQTGSYFWGYVERDERIVALRDEAAQAGDFAQVHLCTQALEGSHAAFRKCVAAILAAQ